MKIAELIPVTVIAKISGVRIRPDLVWPRRRKLHPEAFVKVGGTWFAHYPDFRAWACMRHLEGSRKWERVIQALPAIGEFRRSEVVGKVPKAALSRSTNLGCLRRVLGLFHAGQPWVERRPFGKRHIDMVDIAVFEAHLSGMAWGRE